MDRGNAMLRMGRLWRAALLLGLAWGCGDEPKVTAPVEPPMFSAVPGVVSISKYNVLPRPVLKTLGGVDIFNGGYGSAIVSDPRSPGTFYLMTDRGPNYDLGPNKAFPMPDFAPQIGQFQLRDNLQLVRRIDFRRPDGHRMSGLPNPPGAGGTGEIPVDINGHPLPYDALGVDPEGLALLADGTFWVSDEYGPHLIHLDSNGQQLERISPFSVGRKLPSVLALRRPNRGMEGLAGFPGGRILMGAMQSPLDNPSSAGRRSRNNRLLLFNTVTGASKQFVYQTDAVGLYISEITAVDDNSYLVLERDANFVGAGTAVKRIYRIELSGATDVSDPADGPNGKRFGGLTLEQLDDAGMAANGIVPVKKTLLLDLVPLSYPHDKLEGITVVDDHTIAISDDDDFGVTDVAGGFVQKVLPLPGVTDFAEVWVIRFDQSLRSSQPGPTG